MATTNHRTTADKSEYRKFILFQHEPHGGVAGGLGDIKHSGDTIEELIPLTKGESYYGEAYIVDRDSWKVVWAQS